MSNVVKLPSGSRVLDIPEIPPKAWFREDAEWFVPGQSIQVKLHGPDEGRAQGVVQPPPHMAKYISYMGDRNYGVSPPDARTYPDNFRSVNSGPIDTVTETGEISTIQVGVASIKGDHSQSIGAATTKESLEYLQRKGRWESLASDLSLTGTFSAITEGEYAGGVMFRGMAMPGTTVRDAVQISSTPVSAEVWRDPQYGHQQVMTGVVRCDSTAWPLDVPEVLAAELDCSNGDCIIVSHAEPVPSSKCDCDCGPIAASVGGVDDASMSQLTATIEGLATQIETIESALADLIIEVKVPDQVGQEEAMQAITNQLNEALTRLEELEAAANRQENAEPVTTGPGFGLV